MKQVSFHVQLAYTNYDSGNFCISTLAHALQGSVLPHYCTLHPYSLTSHLGDGVWYRAMCLEERAAKENNIIFLDFGNMAYIDETNIRKMVPDYVRTPVVAVLCVLEGLENSTEKLKQRVRELVQVNKIYKARVVSCSGPGIYSIELPHVTEVLTKENLLSSEK